MPASIDINQYEWDIISQPLSFWHASMRRFLFTLPIWLAEGYGLYKLAYSQQYIQSDQLLYFLIGLELVFISIFNLIASRVSRAFGPKVFHFCISNEGLTMGNKKISLDSLKHSDAATVFEKLALPYQDWHRERPANGSLLECIINSSQGKIKLVFPEEYSRQKFIRSCKGYLNLVPAVNPE